jgi:uncharacterized ion transporter superfamily protein YfcC
VAISVILHFLIASSTYPLGAGNRAALAACSWHQKIHQLTKIQKKSKGPAMENRIRNCLKKIEMPHTFVLLIILVCLAGILTYLIPAGEFSRVKDAAGRLIIVPGTFHLVAANPLPLYEVPLKLFKGLIKGSNVVFFIFIIGGACEIITRTNMINAVIGRLTSRLQGHEGWVIPIFLSAFSIGGFTMGMSDEVLVFVPIGIFVAYSLGFDVITGTAMVLAGAHIGFTAGLMNPFNVGIAQAVAQIPLFSGMWLRIVLLFVLLIVTSIYILRYAKRVKADPAQSLVADLTDLDIPLNHNSATIPEIQRFHYWVLAIVVVGLGLLLYGVMIKKWWIDEMSALFLSMGVLSGLAAGYSPNQISRYFLEGVKGIAFGAFVVGFAQSIIVVIEDGKIIDSVIFYLSSSIGFLPGMLQPIGMYVVNVIIGFLLVSSSGMAMATIPVMAPVSDLLGITRQTTVLMYQCGNGIPHLILPTSAATMGALAAAKIPFERWIKFAMPLELMWLFIGGIFVIVANIIGYQ